jgi:hypothetical protein
MPGPDDFFRNHPVFPATDPRRFSLKADLPGPANVLFPFPVITRSLLPANAATACFALRLQDFYHEHFPAIFFFKTDLLNHDILDSHQLLDECT